MEENNFEFSSDRKNQVERTSRVLMCINLLGHDRMSLW